jgi:membrane associated rhomboid family serine protease
MLNVPGSVLGLLLLLGAVHAVRTLVLSPQVDRLFVLAMAFIPARYDSSVIPEGILPGGSGADIWTFVSYALIHGDLTHLGINAIWLLAFGSPVARRFGTVRFLLFFAVTSAAGALVYLAAHPGELVPVVGASAAVSGTMGAATRFVFQRGGPLDNWRSDPGSADLVPAAPLSVALRNPRVLAFVAIWFALNLVFGIGSVSFTGADQEVAWEAHVGGFLAGLLLFALFDRAGRPIAAGGDSAVHRPESW